MTTMMMDKGMDTGDILLMDKTVIGPEDPRGTIVEVGTPQELVDRYGLANLEETFISLITGKESHA